jgi:hypothetical protein
MGWVYVHEYVDVRVYAAYHDLDVRTPVMDTLAWTEQMISIINIIIVAVVSTLALLASLSAQIFLAFIETYKDGRELFVTYVCVKICG